ncbi:MAG: aminopeptidase N C-terminal domain-containing protein [Proteobacteria bacterium]|nr:aminopeptidase N C-terminal domain-containing protein [Pseudomonadota bacterium]
MSKNDDSGLPPVPPVPVFLEDYRLPEFLIPTVHLDFQLDAAVTRVHSRLDIVPNPGAGKRTQKDLVLDAKELVIEQIKINDRVLSSTQWDYDEDQLCLKNFPAKGALVECVHTISPRKNLALSGLYVSDDILCTQCEPEGFRRISCFIDRPDVLSRYTVTLTADESRYPVLLSNGNQVSRRQLDDGRIEAVWQDPHPKPCYLFALVAGDLLSRDAIYKPSAPPPSAPTEVKLSIYASKKNYDRTEFALDSLERAMSWDEKTFNRYCDLDSYAIVAVDDFNSGAMENKGLNLFNSSYVLADEKTATDEDYCTIDAVVAHEYFHNWTGNRVTCRDWFQLSLKEGLTVFRENLYMSDTFSSSMRIAGVRYLQTSQFSEDAGPTSHPVQPGYFLEISNFYTSTIYEKGAEVIGMLYRLIGRSDFGAGMDAYFERFDGQAVTIQDLVSTLLEHSRYKNSTEINTESFDLWFSQRGTPQLCSEYRYDEVEKCIVLNLRQEQPVNYRRHNDNENGTEARAANGAWTANATNGQASAGGVASANGVADGQASTNGAASANGQASAGGVASANGVADGQASAGGAASANGAAVGNGAAPINGASGSPSVCSIQASAGGTIKREPVEVWHTVPMPVKLSLVDKDGRAQVADVDHADFNTDTRTFVMCGESAELKLRNVEPGSIPVILENFSAPVVLHSPYSIPDLTHLALHAQDPYTRWQVIQFIGLMEMNPGVTMQTYDDSNRPAQPWNAGVRSKEQLLLPTIINKICQEAISIIDAADSTCQHDFYVIAEYLKLPSERFMLTKIIPSDPAANRLRRIWCLRMILEHNVEIITALHDKCIKILATGIDDSATAIGLRSLANTCLMYQCMAGAEADMPFDLVRTQYNLSNMSLKMGALYAINSSKYPLRHELVQNFRRSVQGNLQLKEKYLDLVATAGLGAVDEIRDLFETSQAEEFNIRNPNQVHALIYGFCRQNPAGLHAPDGSGYRLVAECVLRIDAFNPYLSARLARVFHSGHCLVGPLRSQIASVLDILSRSHPSQPLSEIVNQCRSSYT